MTQQIIDQLNGLTQATTDLLTAVNHRKAQLDATLTKAAAHETASAASATTAGQHKNAAAASAAASAASASASEVARAAAVVAQNNAVAVVTGDTASLTPAAGKTPIADAEGLIDPLWIGKLLVREDIGTRPHQVALHQHLGGMAYMQPDAVTIAGGTGLFTGQFGYTSGAGGTVTQATNRNTTVTINKLCGSITLATEAGNTATPKLFVVQNDKVSASDVVHIVVAESSNVYEAKVRRVLNGAFHVRLETTEGDLTDAPVLNFAVIKSTTV